MEPQNKDYIHHLSSEEMRLIQTRPHTARSGRPFDWLVKEKVASGKWRLECVRADILGLSRPLEIYRAERKSNLIKPWKRYDDDEVYCPAHWADLAIGCGACGLRCRACFLMMTHRVKCDPSRHLVYENVEEYERAARRWLQRPDRKNLGLGIDCSDALLYEGVTGHARRLVPLFANPAANPHNCKLILLTKSKNVHYLECLPTNNVLLTFSLNPELIADLWEGKFDDGVRVTPSISERLKASLKGQEMGFEVRWRVDPIFPVDGWQEIYADFFLSAARDGNRPTRITLGTYREMQPSLSTFAKSWGLPSLGWSPEQLVKDGSHYHIERDKRVGIYKFLTQAIRETWKPSGNFPIVALCKEPKPVRREVGLDHEMCNCG